MAAARLNLNGVERVSEGHHKLEELAGAAKGPHSSDLERAMTELDSYRFEQAVATLSASSFGWATVGRCKLRTRAAVMAPEADACAGLGQGGMTNIVKIR